jgi:hypothetical protein
MVGWLMELLGGRGKTRAKGSTRDKEGERSRGMGEGGDGSGKRLLTGVGMSRREDARCVLDCGDVGEGGESGEGDSSRFVGEGDFGLRNMERRGEKRS